MPFDKNWSWIWLTGDQTVSKRPCYLKKLVLSPDGTNAAEVTLHNGENTGGRTIVVVRCAANGRSVLDFDDPLYLDRGLYLDCGANLDGVFVQYMETEH